MNKKMKIFLLAVISAVMLTPSSVFAESQEDIYKKVADGAAGATALPPVLDKNGNIKKLQFVGTGVMYKSLPKAIRLRKAASQAQTDARKAAAQYFNTQVKWMKTEDNEIVCKVAGSAEGDSEGSSRTESTATELTKEQSAEFSQAALSGLIQVYGNANKNDMYVVIYAWNPKSSAIAAQAAKIMGKAARQTITEAKAAEGASLQDPNAAFQNAVAKDAAEDAANTNGGGNGTSSANSSSSRNAAPVVKPFVAPGADDFF